MFKPAARSQERDVSAFWSKMQKIYRAHAQKHCTESREAAPFRCIAALTLLPFLFGAAGRGKSILLRLAGSYSPGERMQKKKQHQKEQ